MLIFNPCEDKNGATCRKDISILQYSASLYKDVQDLLLPSYRICQLQLYALKEVFRITLASTSEYNEIDTLS